MLPRLCGCGQRGCLEAYASGPAIAARAAEVPAIRNHLLRCSPCASGGGGNDEGEETVSAAAVFALAASASASSSPPSPSPPLTAPRPPPSNEEAAASAAAADAAAVVVDVTATHLSRGCLALARAYDPAAFIFAGGVVAGGGALLSLVEAKYRAADWRLGDGARPCFYAASLGDAAPVLGAVAMAADLFFA